VSEVLNRVMKFVEYVPESTCWFWMGAVASKTGQTPVIKLDGKAVPVRRVVYQLEVGEILEDNTRVITSCESLLCVNPDHLIAVPASELTVAGHKTQSRLAGKKTHFPCGHPRSPENMRRQSKGGYDCRECQRARNRELMRKGVRRSAVPL